MAVLPRSVPSRSSRVQTGTRWLARSDGKATKETGKLPRQRSELIAVEPQPPEVGELDCPHPQRGLTAPGWPEGARGQRGVNRGISLGSPNAGQQVSGTAPLPRTAGPTPCRGGGAWFKST